MAAKASVLLIGCGGVGTIAALNLETGGKASVTAVVRSSYHVVKDKGFNIKSIDHGAVKGFKPSTGESPFVYFNDHTRVAKCGWSVH